MATKQGLSARNDQGVYDQGNQAYSDSNAPQTLERTLTPTTGITAAPGESIEVTPDGKSLYMKASDGTLTLIGPSAGGGGAAVQTGPPSSPSTGQLWFDTDEPGASDAADTGWITHAGGIGSSPFTGSTSTYMEYRQVGKIVYFRMAKPSAVAFTPAGEDWSNFSVFLTTLPAGILPDQNVNMNARFDDVPIAVMLNTTGLAVITGGIPRTYALGSVLYVNGSWLL